MIEISDKDTKQVLRLLEHLSFLYSSHGSTREANISRVAGLLFTKLRSKMEDQDKSKLHQPKTILEQTSKQLTLKIK